MIIRKIRSALRLLSTGQAGELWTQVRESTWSDSLAYGLVRDLTVPFEVPAARIPLRVRPLLPADIPLLLDWGRPGTSAEGMREMFNRKLLIDAGIPTCYVAVTEDGVPCYMQWLFAPSENARIVEYFRGIFPALAPDEALLEDAFTCESHRGMGIMPCAMAQIAGEACRFGARRAMTFVDTENIPSLKGCRKAGFHPSLIRRVSCRLGSRRVTFAPLAPGTPYPFEVKGPEDGRAAGPARV